MRKREPIRPVLVLINAMIWFLCASTGQAMAQAIPQQEVARLIVPAIQEWQGGDGEHTLSPQSRIVVSTQDHKILHTEIQQFQADTLAITGLQLTISENEKARNGDIVIRIGDLPERAGSEGYRLKTGDQIELTGSSATGVFYGTQTLLQMWKLSGDRRSLPAGEALDYPQFEMRKIMLDAGRRYYEIEQIEHIMRDMAWKKLNVLHLHFSDWPAFRLNSPAYPGLAPEGESYNRDDIRRLEATAKRYHITIIPEIDLPGHAVALTTYKPSLGFQCPSLRQSPWIAKFDLDRPEYAWTVDITRDENRKWVRDLLNEFIPWFEGPYFHIGGDEYQYDPDLNACPELMASTKARGFEYPGDIFVDWLNEANEIVKTHDKTTVIWSWWRFNNNQTSIQPTKDMVIEIWNSAREAAILEDGYKAIISPEETLYVSPGLLGVGDPGYGIVDLDLVCCNWTPDTRDNVLGYSVAVWSDLAEHQTDQWFYGHAYQPVSLLAERMWAKAPPESSKGFLKRLNRIGMAPAAQQPPYIKGAP